MQSRCRFCWHSLSVTRMCDSRCHSPITWIFFTSGFQKQTSQNFLHVIPISHRYSWIIVYYILFVVFWIVVCPKLAPLAFSVTNDILSWHTGPALLWHVIRLVCLGAICHHPLKMPQFATMPVPLTACSWNWTCSTVLTFTHLGPIYAYLVLANTWWPSKLFKIDYKSL
jgi:hypothetical protein